MCGIVATIGKRFALPILIEGLKRLEYRGYDSSGVALIGDSGPYVLKSVGKVIRLEEKLRGKKPNGKAGIAHTRWATHGKLSEANAHPHSDCKNSLFVVHNGIIENYARLKKRLQEKGHRFDSETDTEVLSHLVEEHYQGNLEAAVQKALSAVEGTFGIAVLHASHAQEIVVARRGSPMILGIGEDESFAASDVSALAHHTRRVVYLEDNEVAVLRAGDVSVTTLENKPVNHPVETIDVDLAAAEKQDFPHYMLKEIFEQPEAVENTLRGRLDRSEAVAKLGGLEPVADRLREARHLIIISCGTSHYAGLYGRYVFETLTDLTVENELASEFRYRKLNLPARTAVLAISQSGETADTLGALREAKRKGALVLGLVNVVGSSIARESDAGVFTHAGLEIGVASTKSFTTQLTGLLLIALWLGRAQNLSYSDGAKLIRSLEKIPDLMRKVLEKTDEIRALADSYFEHNQFLYIGRKFQYPVALEGALKLKEISYIHAEGYAAGEMKHGPIALIDP
ncbi:MAG: glutamine--fructose-6-phosphate transaminase (isomerizing), partial [Acidobacteria bacterium]|nr:glutamine--fructose-6-phosphate transaminase (isomerizing) [Acidobacteriota bacterium]